MGRLIDAERLKSVFEINKANFNTITGIREWIDSQPTAYDVEKVAEQISCQSDIITNDFAEEIDKIIRTNKAIEIARKGGAE